MFRFKVTIILVIFTAITFAALVVSYSQPGWYCDRFKSSANKIIARGKILEIHLPIARLKTKTRIYTMRLGPWWYWREKGWKLKLGERVEVDGYLMDDLLFPITIKTAHSTMRFRDSNGLPCWRGMHRHLKQHHQF